MVSQTGVDTMSVGWKCKHCEHMNADGHGAVGQHLMLGICGIKDNNGCGKNTIMVPFEEVVL